MRICIFGAGAIGGYLAAILGRAGLDVTVIARGPHLAAIKERGLTLRSATGEFTTRPKATDDPVAAGAQDYVIVTLKAHALPPVAAKLQPLFGPETAVVTALNGIPFWYFHKLEEPWNGRRVESVDPGGVVSAAIDPERVIGAVVYPAAEVVEPGVVRHVEGDRFPLGEPDGSRSPRVAALSEAMIAAGLRAPVRPRIRDEIWIKLWGNCSFNPISALTGATLDRITADPGTRGVARAMMIEAQAIGEKLGVRFGIDVDRRIQGAAEIGAHKTSMLQDLERGRPLEIDALVGAVAELGRLVAVPTPMIGAVLALVRQRAQVAGCYP